MELSAFQFVLFLVLCPAIFGLLIILSPGKLGGFKSLFAFIAAGFNLFMAIRLFSQVKTSGEEISQIWPWAGMGIDFSIFVDYFSAMIILAAAFFAILIIFYTIAYIRRKHNSGLLYFYMLFALSLVSGAVMANNLVMLLFFWVGLSIIGYGMIMLEGLDKHPIAAKSLIIGGWGDLLLMLGLAITAFVGETLTINAISPIPLEGIAVLGFLCATLGAIAKAGALPFSIWLPKAGEDAPLPFMAILPGALNLLLGVYLLSRIFINYYIIEAFSSYSHLIMLIGLLTVLIPLVLAFMHKNLKRIITYIAISQAGFMVLGIGTSLPMGITGGLFHMLNSTIFISCLFLAAGAIQRQTGNIDLSKLGGIGKYLPITTLCFLIGAASAVGVPLFNGFSSRELILAAAFENGLFYYIFALLGVFLSALLLFKVFCKAFLGKPLEDYRRMREAPGAMLLPMFILALVCIVFGVYNPLPLRVLIEPAIVGALGEVDFSGLPQSFGFGIITLLVIIIAVFGHLLVVKKWQSLQKLWVKISGLPGLNAINKLFGVLFNKIRVFFSKWYAQGRAAALKALIWLKEGLIFKTTSKALSIYTRLRQGKIGKFSKYIPYAFMGLGVVICVFMVIYLNAK